MELLTFEELCDRTELTKYEIRYYQESGFFDREYNVLLLDLTEPGRRYDARWVQVWQEARLYMEARFESLDCA